ncbi:MAG TPA: hypothetical protein VMV94_16435 [Phycisphaerae bacterium]|nr:hypothetical protein [Phycisphaerae bacterium]
MRKRIVLLSILGLTACICWALGSAVADQPSVRTGGQVAPGAAADTSASSSRDAKPVNLADQAGMMAPATGHLKGTVSIPDGYTPTGAGHDTGPQGGTPKTSLLDRIQPSSPNMPHRYAIMSSADGSGATEIDPRSIDPNNPCFPATQGGGQCGPAVYDNLEPNGTNFYFGISNGEILMDDIWLAGTQRELCSVTIRSQGVGPGTYSYTIELWTGCPLDAGSVKIGPTISSGTISPGSGGRVDTLTYPFNAVVPTFFWIVQTWTLVGTTSAVGPHITDLAEVGFSADSFGMIEGTPPVCNLNYWFGGYSPPSTPGASFSYAFNATGSDVGKCCYGDCASCVDTTYSDCMARAGGPEFMLGTTCATAPFCRKGACCLTTGACLDDKTKAECQATPNYLSWTLGARCTLDPVHPSIPVADCAAAPANDLCSAAISLTGTCLTRSFDNTNASATVLLGDPVSCLGGNTPADANDDVQIANDIWYFYTVPTTYNGTAISRAYVVISTLGSAFDSVIVAYARPSSTAACGVAGAITCADPNTVITTPGYEVGCNDDIVGLNATHAQIQDSYVVVDCDGAAGPLPGGCILIRVGSLQQTGGHGGPGFLNVDLIPYFPAPFGTEEGVCCLPAGGCVLTNDSSPCSSMGGYFRSTTDFFEGGDPGAPEFPQTTFEAKAQGCCHGAFGGCQVGEYCGNPIDLDAIKSLSWSGDVWKVTFFKFTTREFQVGDPGYPGTDPHYAITIDTCGSAFDTILSIYSGPGGSGGELDFHGDCMAGYLIKQNDDCSVDTAGAEGHVSCAGAYTTTSCICLTVGTDPGLYDLLNGIPYYVAVGMKDTRTGTGLPIAQGIDPAPNYPNEPKKALALNIQDGWKDCSACSKSCCKGDMNGDGVLDGMDIQKFITVLITSATSPYPCTLANPSDPNDPAWNWCRANMNGDSVVDVHDIGGFVNALLVPWPCDLTDYCGVDGYCQPADQGGFYVSDPKQSIRVADNFISLTGGQVTRVCWWGFDAFRAGSTWGPCTTGTPTDNFSIRFFKDGGGRPGDLMASFAGIPMATYPAPGVAPYYGVKTATGQTFDGAAEYKYQVQIPPVVVEAGDCTWMEIVNTTSAGDCWWAWEVISSADFGDGKAAVYEDGYYRWVDGTDLAFCLNIPLYSGSCQPACTVVCPVGAAQEGEPDCGPGFVDTTDGGCWVDTPLFKTITNGQTYCGTTGIYPSATPGFVERDGDWYKLTLTGSSILTVGVQMDFNLIYFILGPYNSSQPCANWGDPNDPHFIEGWQITPCASGVSIDTILPSAGEYHILVVPNFDYFWDQPCGSKYTLKTKWVPVPIGACCSGTTCQGPETESACCARGTQWTWYKDKTCSPNPCLAGTLLWDNYPCTSTTLPSGATCSQRDTAYSGTGFNAQVADDFIFTQARTITRARWVGNLYNGTGPNQITAFKVFVYANATDRPTGSGTPNPTGPDSTALTTITIPIASVSITTNTDTSTKTYEATLPSSFTVPANTRRWIVFQAQLNFAPQWGISTVPLKTGSLHGWSGFPLLGTPFWTTLPAGREDMAFRLYGN